jgi:NADPH:quinone reductase-like Zn-dependent oxidoreductase
VVEEVGLGAADLVPGDEVYYTPNILNPGSNGAYSEALRTTLRRGGERHGPVPLARGRLWPAPVTLSALPQ